MELNCLRMALIISAVRRLFVFYDKKNYFELAIGSVVRYCKTSIYAKNAGSMLATGRLEADKVLNNIIDVFFYKPQIEDLWFRESMMADPDTMSYNNAWGGTIPFPREKWSDWYDYWVGNPKKRFYRYVTTGKSRAFVGEAAYHYDEDLNIYLSDVIIASKYRRKGFGKAGLQMLCEAARKENIPELYDNIAIDNPGITLFLQCGFQEDYRTEEIIMLKKKL